jgi:hypothetical protein
MTAESDVLKTNDAFYAAFAARDLSDMEELWARTGPVSCVHPGWDVLLNRDEIIASWSNIFSSPDAPNISHQNGNVQFLLNRDIALVTCQELIDGRPALIATNIYVNTYSRYGWTMVHHQAGHFDDALSQPVPGTTVISKS